LTYNQMSYPLDLIACPVCHGSLESAGSSLRCPACDRSYAASSSVDFTPIPPPDAEVQNKWPLWEKLQANFLAAATAVPEHSLSVTVRPDAEAFAQFCDFAGTVLDVGCGTQRLPTYADVGSCRFVGIDPLPGEPDRGFEFVHGLGEFLPFRSDCFDQVLFATSLDHMLVPRRALSEARRVLRSGGAVNIWFGEVDRPSKQSALRRVLGLLAALRSPTPADPPEEPDYLAVLDQPDGAIDKFHVSYPSVREIEDFFTDVGFEQGNIQRVDFASGCFVRGLKSS
jgi:SAM-dependent methyltransferase